MVNGDFVSNWVLTHSEPPPYALESQPLYTHPPRREQDDAEIVSLRAEVERLRAVAEQQPVADDALRLADGNAEMEDMLRIQHAIILELRAEVERLAQDYVRACKLVAGMHAAATGRPGEGTRLGVVEDVAAVREEVERLREALEHLIERAATSDDCQYGTLSTSYVRDIARAALARKETT
jgi:hypothetical protein